MLPNDPLETNSRLLGQATPPPVPRPPHLSIERKYRVIQNECRSTIVQRQFRNKFGKPPPSDNSIPSWYVQFQETECVCIPELKVRIRTATETITTDMRNELDYRVDVCRITKGAHIEHLYGM